MKEFTAEEVAEHKSISDMYLTIDNKVYNVTAFLQEHPGGEEVILELAGQDASEPFEDIGHSQDARDLLKDMLVGVIKGAKVVEQASKGVAKSKKAKAPSYSAFYALLPLIVAALAYYQFSTSM
jgi:cytochrome b5